MKALLERLLSGGDLSSTEAGSVMHALTDEALPEAVGGALLAALRSKGETAEEIRGFVAVAA